MLTAGRALPGVVVGLLLALAGLLLVPAPAQAAGWQTVSRLHGGHVQVCAAPTASGFQVRVRVDNRRSTHPHVGALQAPDGRQRLVPTARGRLSGVRSLVVRRGARVVVGIGEADGSGAVADERRASRIRRC